ncbi:MULTISPECIES: agmatinase [unclassified Lentimicrobium]|uniref:agmatinase n=1 Tax=unclassified Lentimicrobium TaxID=2677434 RepID=UPI001C130E34|nr:MULTISPECIES: agmatinase [unclassified Lentimicrobium]
MKNFGGIEDKYADFKSSAILLQSIPYDGTSTWGKGADKGFAAFLDAAENMELYDMETDSEVYEKGIHILPEIIENRSPEASYEAIYEQAKKWVETDKFLTFFGGEHSISIGIIKALYEKYPDLTVVHLDAHADLRESYMGSPYNHACALHDASKNTNLIQVGIRSMDVSEMQFINADKCFFAQDIVGNRNDWMEEALELINTKHVYITIDLDAFDPSILPATGTPEPGGLEWYPTLEFLRGVFENNNVVGFDLVELAPIENHKASEFLAAKLYYKLLSYKFKYDE